jgi:alpha-glucosidase (family GH31 glycosyl hydrolase)
VAEVARKAYTWRLRALPYHYTAFYDAHTFGCSVMRPLFFSFPSDATSYAAGEQWMLGDALLVAPVLDQGATSVSVEFPPAVWYNLYDYSSITGGSGNQSLSVRGSPKRGLFIVIADYHDMLDNIIDMS